MLTLYHAILLAVEPPRRGANLSTTLKYKRVLKHHADPRVDLRFILVVLELTPTQGGSRWEILPGGSKT